MTNQHKQQSLASAKVGNLIHVTYEDHIVWCDKDPTKFNDPWVLETCGWVSFENETAIRIAWERLIKPSNLPEDGRFPQKGLTIVKSTIVKLEVLST